MLFSALLLLSSLHNVVAQRHDADLMSFVTLPEVRALRWDVHYLDRARAEPGYWFVAPYGQISPEMATKKYQQYQVGPYIYDDNGMLIWAGSLFWDNQNVFDFHAVHDLSADNETHISMIVNWERDGPGKGKGVMMNKHYHVETEVNVLNDLHDFNMHEFNILPGGKTALACTYRSREISMEDFGRPAESSFIVSGGFVELDMETSEILVQWESFDHIPLHESNMFHAWDNPMGDPGWDYVHINAVDKNLAGDYIISLRFTNTVYLISGEDGHIMWRLGGLESDFDMDFTFSKQHDVKFVSSNGTHHVISMLNNASDERGNDENLSSALFIEIDTVAMTARVISRINRPDSDLTRLRGSVSTLPNGNVFIGWSEFGYQSEHAANGDLLMTSRFVGDRYSTYRAYKSDFIGRPTTPPDVVASVYGTSEEDITTIIYVSWNGATDVVGWNLYAKAYDHGEPVKIGHATKTDFETMYIVDGYMDWITAEAVDVNGDVMSTSRVARSDIPQNWMAVGFLGDSGPSPDDPSIIASVNKGSTSTSDSTIDTNTDTTDAVEADKTVTDTTDSSSGMDGMDMSDDSTSDAMDHDNTSYADAKEVAKAVYRAYEVIRGIGGLLIFILLACSTGGVIYGIWRCLQARKRRSYQHVPSEEGIPVEEIHLRSQQPE
ncbi:hypothetical protein N7448_008182 [Penicillium atrosanguineum]|uniref:ASST-domain-containing protein n=1 Tax=Penicillium atrosanguineum TaxID=1132637 RepID=A0A9W9GQV4_9EURO|nr:Thioesterase superfamily [Penicillium atrosanguineum]KAJ5127403.1 hypothetical protein N7448_008182 [Penicillium atrosanguineum]KAJ5147606.1 hypothetical protein N7526_000958 [Penicillium atrosanguineum]KAJ5313920.1 Thioesterase superfamily [Penicillium atrosanguineum]KAJ5331090.1 hypothetical protein N7476_000873 [Penicillium atrosanguineum]